MRIEQQRPVQVRQGLVEPADAGQQPGPCEQPIRFVRLEVDGQVHVVEGPLRLSQGVMRPGPRRRSPRPSAASARRLRGNPPGPFPAARSCGSRCRGPGGRGDLGSQLDLPGIVGDGQVELSLAAVDPCPPGIELSTLRTELNLRRELFERVLAFGELAGALAEVARACDRLSGGGWPGRENGGAKPAEGRPGP